MPEALNIPDKREDRRIDLVVVEFHDADNGGEFLSWESAYNHIVTVCAPVYPMQFFTVPKDMSFYQKIVVLESTMQMFATLHNIPDNYWFEVYTKTIFETEE